MLARPPSSLPGGAVFGGSLQSLRLPSRVAAQGRAQPGRALLPALLPRPLRPPLPLPPPAPPRPPTRLPLGSPLSRRPLLPLSLSGVSPPLPPPPNPREDRLVKGTAVPGEGPRRPRRKGTAGAGEGRAGEGRAGGIFNPGQRLELQGRAAPPHAAPPEGIPGAQLAAPPAAPRAPSAGPRLPLAAAAARRRGRAGGGRTPAGRGPHGRRGPAAAPLRAAPRPPAPARGATLGESRPLPASVSRGCAARMGRSPAVAGTHLPPALGVFLNPEPARGGRLCPRPQVLGPPTWERPCAALPGRGRQRLQAGRRVRARPADPPPASGLRSGAARSRRAGAQAWRTAAFPQLRAFR